MSDGFITISRLQSTKDGNLVKVAKEESKMTASMFESLDGFSLVSVPMYWQSSKSALLLVSDFKSRIGVNG